MSPGFYAPTWPGLPPHQNRQLHRVTELPISNVLCTYTPLLGGAIAHNADLNLAARSLSPKTATESGHQLIEYPQPPVTVCARASGRQKIVASSHNPDDQTAADREDQYRARARTA